VNVLCNLHVNPAGVEGRIKEKRRSFETKFMYYGNEAGKSQRKKRGSGIEQKRGGGKPVEVVFLSHPGKNEKVNVFRKGTL